MYFTRFRWAVCQLDGLGNCLNLPMLRKALKSLPKTLDETYARVLCNIDEEHSENALKMLRWLTYSARPLQIEEIAEVVAVDVEDDPRFDSERRFPEPRDILIMCSSLVTMTAEETENPHAETIGEQVRGEHVRLAHFSVKEYLVSERIRAGPAIRYSIRAIDANVSIAEICLAYLLLFDRPTSSKSRILGEFPLARYAARYWTQHARWAGKGASEIHQMTLELFLSKRDAYINWIWLFNPDRPWRKSDIIERPKNVPLPLYHASLAGLVESVILLLETGPDVNAQGGEYGNALQAASREGYDEIVQRLLDAGADANAQGGLYGNALQAASFHGHSQIVQGLLDAGAEVNAQGGKYANALHAASREGHDRIVQQLLDAGADANAQGGFYGNALQAASFYGHDQVVQRLLDVGAEVNMQRGMYGNALQAASRNGHDQVVQQLLNAGADANAYGGEYGNAVTAASRGGFDQVVQQLLEKGADLNAQGGKYGNALQAASVSGHEQVIQRLLNAGADVNAQGGLYGNALQTASGYGHYNVVQRLLDAGADVNAHGGEYNNALQAASVNGHDRIVQRLLDAGAKVNAQGGKYSNALNAALVNSHDQVVQMLLNAGAKANTQATSVVSRDRTAQRLLEGNANTNALQATSGEGADQIFQLLLAEGGSDVNAKDKDGRTALQRAAYSGQERVVRLLVEYYKEHGITIPDEDARLFSRLFCDDCGSKILNWDAHYHCSICYDDDFDICQECVDKGVHCSSDEHQLVKRCVKNGKFVVETNDDCLPN